MKRDFNNPFEEYRTPQQIQMQREAMETRHAEWHAVVVAWAMIITGSVAMLLGLAWYFI